MSVAFVNLGNFIVKQQEAREVVKTLKQKENVFVALNDDLHSHASNRK